MLDHDKKNYYVDLFGLYIIGFVSLGYVLFGASFAEYNFQLPFLDFPIFVGEMLIGACATLFLLKYGVRFKKRHIGIIAFFSFVVIKALWGYAEFGALSLRNAAMFYYLIFIVFGACFYRRDFFDMKRSLMIIAVILALFATRKYGEYWTLTWFCMVFILGYAITNRTVKFFVLTALFLATPYNLFFATSRMMMIANFAVGIYLIMSLYLISRANMTVKSVLAILGFALIVLLGYHYSDKIALLTLSRPSIIIEKFIEHDELAKYHHNRIMEERKRDGISEEIGAEQDRQVLIFNPNNAAEDQAVIQRLHEAVVRMRKLKIAQERREAEMALLEAKARQATGEEAELLLEQISKTRNKTIKIAEFDKIEDRTNFGELSEQYKPRTPSRDVRSTYGNAVFRLMIWRDMMVEMVTEQPLKSVAVGKSFGKPFRSVSLEALFWGFGDWFRDGWIGAHNSFIHLVYRAGLIGLLTIIGILTTLGRMIKISFQCRSVAGLFLCGIIINWLIAANFLLILELPYTAVPLWSIFGLTYAYVHRLKLPGAPVINTKSKRS